MQARTIVLKQSPTAANNFAGFSTEVSPNKAAQKSSSHLRYSLDFCAVFLFLSFNREFFEFVIGIVLLGSLLRFFWSDIFGIIRYFWRKRGGK
jgi:hypothetical protein